MLAAAAVLVPLGPALSAPAAQAPTTVIANSGSVAPPSCPVNPCVVISRTTAVQVKDGSNREPFEIHKDGEIVAWSVTLAVPSTGQVHYFDSHEGGTSRAELAVLRSSGGLRYKLVARSPLVHLQPYFGKTAQLELAHPITVTKGELLALSVPTWLPALALGYPGTTSWRASRDPADCANVTDQTAQTRIGATARYDCLYQTALVTYSAAEAASG
jgi:hypothetical protein